MGLPQSVEDRNKKRDNALPIPVTLPATINGQSAWDPAQSRMQNLIAFFSS
jgi:hypothetical protein